ncbi:SdpI family protein [Sinanaerobacter sp. ZZT-01]|uniref:SdpI family protein n=1 Tax=Sinanaerobacter sp. ZZT-01 TaxID=3111540 RepID=UPI002D7900B1|nr:SdpI family protein [Sinanaerobacter sp. ZZT-01]WRR92309.1 SdpI family protein [Sinanaerobacter sp. ZZT-01]
MRKKNDFSIWITTLVCLLPMILSIVLYDKLPEQVAVHFDSMGKPNGYAPRFVAAFGIPLLMAAINLFTHVVLNSDPKKGNASIVMRRIAKWIIPILTVLLVPATLFMAMGMDIPLQMMVPCFVGVLIIACGNYMPKSKQNYTVGIKLPWTLNSETNWNKTHRMAGYVWIAGGILLVLSSFFEVYAFPITIGVILLLAVIPFLYSYFLYKKGI